jgi:hypothetical protein
MKQIHERGMTRLERLEEAVRVRVNRQALSDLRETARAMRAMAGSDRERREAAALRLLLEMHEKIGKALA